MNFFYLIFAKKFGLAPNWYESLLEKKLRKGE